MYNASMQDCIFCKIANKESQATIEGENEHAIAFANIKPVADTHILVIPKKHIHSFLDIVEAEILEHMMRLAQEVIKNKKIENAYKLVFNGGKYQAIPHVHWHILGGDLEDHNDVLNQT